MLSHGPKGRDIISHSGSVEVAGRGRGGLTNPIPREALKTKSNRRKAKLNS